MTHATDASATKPWRLYGTPSSLYTAKARSYLIKQGVPFESCAAGESHFRNEIVPRISRWIIPVVEHDDGAIVPSFRKLSRRRRRLLDEINPPA